MRLSGVEDRQLRDVVAARVTVDDDKPTWTNLGNPNQTSAVARRGVGTPAVVPLAAGRLLMLVRNYGKGLSGRVGMDDGSWSRWVDFGGHDIQDGLAAVRVSDATAVVYGASHGGITKWTVDSASSTSDVEVLRGSAPASPPSAVRTADGKTAVVVRVADSSASAVYVAQPDTNGALSMEDAYTADGVAGPGPVKAAVADSNDDVFLVWRDDQGRVAASWLTAGNTRAAIAPSDFVILNAPSVTVDSEGRMVVAAIDASGGLRTIRQLKPGLQGKFGAWQGVAV
jgi:hypothetical protein